MFSPHVKSDLSAVAEMSSWIAPLVLLVLNVPNTDTMQQLALATSNLENDAMDVLKVLLKFALPFVSEVAANPEISSLCSSTLLSTVAAYKRKDPWLIRSKFVYFFQAFLTLLQREWLFNKDPKIKFPPTECAAASPLLICSNDNFYERDCHKISK